MNYRSTLTILATFTLLLSTMSWADMESVKTKTFDGEKFMFPKDVKGSPLSLLFLAMSADRDNGTLQQEQLIAWHKKLEEENILTEQVSAYHFPVMESPPFFVKGIIRNAMAEVYEGTAATNQSGVLYVKDLQAFADSGKLTLDDKPTLVLLSSEGAIISEFKGSVSDENVVIIKEAINANLPTKISEKPENIN